MSPADIPLLAMVREALNYHSSRQRVIADNVANANTPGFTPGDIPLSAFERVLEGTQPRPAAVGLQRTREDHLAGAPVQSRRYDVQASPDSETTVNGNSVVLEEQIVAAADNRMRFESALSLYQRSLNMIRLAARSPGQ